jgi:hypothetical protein
MMGHIAEHILNIILLTYMSVPYSIFKLLKSMPSAYCDRSTLCKAKSAGSETCNKTGTF